MDSNTKFSFKSELQQVWIHRVLIGFRNATLVPIDEILSGCKPSLRSMLNTDWMKPPASCMSFRKVVFPEPFSPYSTFVRREGWMLNRSNGNSWCRMLSFSWRSSFIVEANSQRSLPPLPEIRCLETRCLHGR